MNKPKILLKIVNKDGKVKTVSTQKSRRVYKIIGQDKFQNCLFKLKVSYKNAIYSDKGQKVKGGSNKGCYNTKEELINALEHFLEVDS